MKYLILKVITVALATVIGFMGSLSVFRAEDTEINLDYKILTDDLIMLDDDDPVADLPPVIVIDGEPDKVVKIAHTGRAAKAAQNSVLAFRLAGEAGYWGIETDLRWTSDHVLCCFHDESLDTHTNGTGSFESRPWSYISTLTVSAGNTDVYGEQPIASFAEYLDICKMYGCVAVIDIKWCSAGYHEMLRAAYDMVQEKGMLSSAVFQCSVESYLEALYDIDPSVRLWRLCGENGAVDESVISKAADTLHCEAACIPVNTKTAVDLSHKYDLMCIYYQTDSLSEQEKCFANGFDLVMENGKN